MKRLADPMFITYAGLWILVHLCRRLHQPLPLLNGHLTDFIAAPVIAHITLTITRTFIVKNQQYSYPLSYLLFIACYLSVVFEWIAPQLSPVYTRDAWDIAAYFAGSLFYYYFHPKNYPQKNHTAHTTHHPLHTK
ncbi:hypothetical protein ACTJJ0_32265 [Chitinophaga sp. 22321]|uniref:Magnesium citrate secondary transporter n=1 Tax=Chitinophaga hostae TaxID=2831022 RepID=A0ABS5IXU6_9BACT|nr:hypothetical protein [Chitinophaga hostae]MBS0027606.1 hypothetical protein [Chitinophaga hostae]